MVSFATRNVEKPEKTWKMNPRKLGNKAGISWWRLDQVSGGLYFTIHPSTSHQISLRFQGPHSKSDKLLFKMKNCFFSFFGASILGRGCNILQIHVTFFVTTLHPHPVWVHPLRPSQCPILDLEEVTTTGSGLKKKRRRERMAWRIWRHLKDKNNDCSIESSVLTLR